MVRCLKLYRHSKRIYISCASYQDYQFAIDHLEGESVQMQILRRVARRRIVYLIGCLFAIKVKKMGVTDALLIESNNSAVSMSCNGVNNSYSVRKKHFSVNRARNEGLGLIFISQLLEENIAFYKDGIIYLKYFDKKKIKTFDDAKAFIDNWLQIVVFPSLETVEGIKLCVTHGDLAVWNLFSKGDRIFPLDWEFYDPQGLCGLDIFRFWTSYYQVNGNLELCKREIQHSYALLGISKWQKKEIERVELKARKSDTHLYKFME